MVHIKVVGFLEYFVEGNLLSVQSNCKLVCVGFDDHTHQVHRTRTQVPRRCTIRSSCIDGLGLLSPRVNLQTSEGDWYRREVENGANKWHTEGPSS